MQPEMLKKGPQAPLDNGVCTKHHLLPPHFSSLCLCALLKNFLNDPWREGRRRSEERKNRVEGRGRGEEEGRGRSEIEWKEGKEEGGDRILRRERRGRRRKRDKGEGGMRGGTKGEEEEVSIAHTHTHTLYSISSKSLS